MLNVLRLLCCAIFCLSIVTTALAAEKKPVVLFDEAHGERFLPQRENPLALTQLADLFFAQGFEIRIGKDPISRERLNGIDAIVISGPFAPFTPEEIEILHQYVAEGGRLAIMLHVAPIVSQLLSKFEVIHSNGVIREEEAVSIERDPLNFYVTSLANEPLFSGVNHFAVYGCWALMTDGKNSHIVASSGKKSWIDLNGDKVLSQSDAMQPFGIAVSGEIGKGNYAVFGDDAIFQNRFLTGGNLKLGENLVNRLKP